MKTLTLVWLAAGILALPSLAWQINFDDVKPGVIPPGWQVALTGQGEPDWSCVPDDSAPSRPNVLKQTSNQGRPYMVVSK